MSAFRSHRVLPHTPKRVFDAFARPEVLARWWGPDGFVIHHVSPPRYRLRVTLAATLATDVGGTVIEWIQEFEDPAVAERIRHIVEPANEQNLNRLAAVLEEARAGDANPAK